jgi:hypothetical protein
MAPLSRLHSLPPLDNVHLSQTTLHNRSRTRVRRPQAVMNTAKRLQLWIEAERDRLQ